MLTFAMSDAVLYSYNQEITGEVRLSPIWPECYREIQENAPVQRVQQGLRGKELSDKLKEHDMIKKGFAKFVSFHKGQALLHKFPVWAVSLEHSRNAKHPARVIGAASLSC